MSRWKEPVDNICEVFKTMFICICVFGCLSAILLFILNVGGNSAFEQSESRLATQMEIVTSGHNGLDSEEKVEMLKFLISHYDPAHDDLNLIQNPNAKVLSIESIMRDLNVKEDIIEKVTKTTPKVSTNPSKVESGEKEGW